MSQHPNLFVTVLTNAAPSSNYRGESEENRTVLQKITRGSHQYTIISPESMRNALREILTQKGLPMNRRRLNDEEQLAVAYQDYPDPDTYADDFLFGYLVAQKKDSETMRKKKKRPAKRDSILRMNLAVALAPYRYDATFHQSPATRHSPWANDAKSNLLHREIVHTAYQYPFALCGDDCAAKAQGIAWTRELLRAIGEFANVAGGHARSYFEMSPRSIVARVTPSLVAGFDTYGFRQSTEDAEREEFPDLARIHDGDLPGSEFWIGGALARTMRPERKQHLIDRGVHFHDNPQTLLDQLGDATFGERS